MKKEILAIICMIVLSLTYITCFPVNAANIKKIKLNKKSVTIYIGKKVKLKVKTKGKVKWKSSNRKIATVTKKGVVKAKKAGRTKIIAYKGRRKAICKVVVKKKKNKSPVISPPPLPNGVDKRDTIAFYNYDDFFKSVQTAKNNYLSNKVTTIYGLEKVEYFFDFKEINENIRFDSIVVSAGSVMINYYDRSVNERTMDSSNNKIFLDSELSMKNDNYVDSWYRAYNEFDNAEKITINGVSAVKNIVRRDGKLSCYQYRWTQEGYNIFLALYKGIVEKYDEKDFFDVQKVKVPD